jgi:hypothetical protein
MDPVRTKQMGRLWQGIVSTVFWSYERGSWPYDILVIAILVFVLATPRSWFRDEPRQGLTPTSSVHLESADEGNQTRTYRLDAAALSLDKRTTRRTPELDREAHDILGRTVVDLGNRTFQVVRIEPALGSDGSVLYYDVTVHL